MACAHGQNSPTRLLAGGAVSQGVREGVASSEPSGCEGEDAMRHTRTLLQCLTSLVSRLTATSATPELSSIKLRGEDSRLLRSKGAGPCLRLRYYSQSRIWVGAQRRVETTGNCTRRVACGQARTCRARFLVEKQRGRWNGVWCGAGGPLVDAPVAEMDEFGPVGSVEQQLVLGALRGNAARSVPA